MDEAFIVIWRILMSTLSPEMIHEPNLSHAWGRTFRTIIDRPQRALAPLMISVTGFDSGLPTEDIRIRMALDNELARHNKIAIDTSAMLIFPYLSWTRRGQPPCREFSEWYIDSLLPRLKARDQRNRRGTYFERMIAASGVKETKGEQKVRVVNQLDHMIAIWKRDERHCKRPRQSALQVSCFDPIKDHTGAALLGFPCLHHVNFSYEGEDLALTATYPTQYIFDRAYGNYLGLCHLGYFMAHELGMKFTRFNCLISHPELGSDVSKVSLRNLTDTVREVLQEADSDRATRPNQVAA